uniref:Uncharacterized protein n=1 Tax=Arundo donax TaxID=35708 RepID=A0A0A9E110_ARUDO
MLSSSPLYFSMRRRTSSITSADRLFTLSPAVLYRLKNPRATLGSSAPESGPSLLSSSRGTSEARRFSAHSRHVAVPRSTMAMSRRPMRATSLSDSHTAT